MNNDADQITEAIGLSVFHDLGFEDADEQLEKARIVRRIQRLMDERGLTQTELGSLIGMQQTEVSRLLRGRLDRFTFDRLFRALRALGVPYVIMLPEDASVAPTAAR